MAVSEETRERALRAIKELDYQPNRHAQGLRRQNDNRHPGLVHNTFLVAVLNGGASADNFMRNNGATYDGIMEAASERGIYLMLNMIPAAQCGQPIPPPCLAGLGYDAILASPHPTVEGTALARAGRVVWFGSRPRGVEAPTVVEPDSVQGIETMVRYLHDDLGHRRIAFACQNTMHIPYRDRRNAFRAATCDLDLAPCEPAELTDETRLDEFVEAIRRSSRRPTAVLVASDGLGARLVTGLVEAGLRVPEDISVTGFDGRDKSRWCTPGLTTWEVDWHGLGRNVVHQALLMMTEQHSARVLVGGRILEQGSTGKAPDA